MRHFSFTGGRNGLFVAAILLSLLLALYAPMSSVTNAQSAVDMQKLQALKQNAVKELDRRINSLASTLAALNQNVDVDENNLGIQTGITTSKAVVTSETKDKVKSSMQKYIDKLAVMKEKVETTGKLTDMQSLGKSIDSQYGLDQMANVQGTTTKAVESLTGVFDKLKVVSSSLQGQVTAIQGCATGDDAAGVCKNVTADAKSAASTAQSQLDNVDTVISTIGSILLSVVTLLQSLLTTFGTVTGGLGSLSDLGDVSGLGSLESLNGLLNSFTSVLSQLDFASGMAGSAQGVLGNVANMTKQFNF